jgi:hypothetical protein
VGDKKPGDVVMAAMENRNQRRGAAFLDFGTCPSLAICRAYAVTMEQ